MKVQPSLVTWIGTTDHDCVESKRAAKLGVMANAMQGDMSYDCIYLLTNYVSDRDKNSSTSLELECSYEFSVSDLHGVDLNSPYDHENIYTKGSSNLLLAGLTRKDARTTLHVCPGIPVNAAN